MLSLSPVPPDVPQVNPGIYHYRTDNRIDNPVDHGIIANDTLHELKEGVEQTTEIIRRKHEQMQVERRAFEADMEVRGRMSVSPASEWIALKLRAVSNDDLTKDLNNIKQGQKEHAVTDTLAALVYDVNATAEVLRRGLRRDSRDGKDGAAKQEVEYKLRLTPAPPDEHDYWPEQKTFDDLNAPPADLTLDQVQRDYGVSVDESETSSMKRRRARSETPRRTLQIEPPTVADRLPICAYCNEQIEGQVLTALAPNSVAAQKFHTYHFMCTYCQKTLTQHGTYREHDSKPYCHDCFYKLYNGLLYEPDQRQARIEKLI